MDFADSLYELSKKASVRVKNIRTEEATKSGLVMPFINMLGYNVFDPTEVVPEFTADIGERKGERVDYAILKDEKPIMLFECKLCGSELAARSATQLQLLQVLQTDPFQSQPPFEKLVGDLTGAYSRRINIQHRLVYQVLKNERVVKVIRMWTYYE